MDRKWTSVKVIKTIDAATAVAFSPPDYDQRYALDRKAFITLTPLSSIDEESP